MNRAFRLLAVSFFIASTCVSISGQVQVTLKTNQAEYLEGEPIFVVAYTKNVGTEPVAYSDCAAHADITIPSGRKRRTPNLYGCFGGARGSGGGCVVDHPPWMKPGETVAFWFLLKGYDLRAGDYVLHISGNAGVRWKNAVYPPVSGPAVVLKHLETEPVEGRAFDETMKLTVRNSTEAQLRRRFAPYVADADDTGDMERLSRAREAIAETAPVFLDGTLLGFADRPEWARLAVEGLGRIPTADSRSDLVMLFDESADLRLRSLIVQKLAGIGTLREVAFFASLLPGRSTVVDDEIRTFAALGLGRIGGSEAVKELEVAPRSPNPDVRESIAMALGNTRDSTAIPVLILMYAGEGGRANYAVCPALATLTHLRWCDGSGNVSESRARWRKWWSNRPSPLPLYGADECPELETSLPEVK